MNCPKCAEPCYRDSVDVLDGPNGTIYGPWGCSCGWSEDPYYDASGGPSPAQTEAPPGRYVDSTGTSHSVDRIAENLARFGIPQDHVRTVFDTTKTEEAPP